MRKKTFGSWHTVNWGLCKEITTMSYGYRCIIQGCGATANLQLDHAISRSCKSTYYETDILNWLCGQHHTHKSFRKNQWVDHEVRATTIRNIGQERWDELIFQSKKPCGNFKSILHQEQENMRLKEKRAELMGGLC